MNKGLEKKQLAEKHSPLVAAVIFWLRQKKRSIKCRLDRHDWKYVGKDSENKSVSVYICTRCGSEDKV